MATSNPAFNRSPAFSSNRDVVAKLQSSSASVKTENMTAAQLTDLYSVPSATPSDTDRMTYEDTMVKIVVSLVNIFKKKPSPALVLSYAAVEGIFVGGITVFFESRFPGIAVQAVLGTLVVVGVTLALFVSGKIRASKRATKVFLIAMIGYGVFSLINFILIATGVNSDAFGLRGTVLVFGIPLGVILGPLVIIMAAYSLVLDFDSIKTGVQRGAQRIYGWTAAFGIMVTVVWLYLEILRLLALLRR
jgi:uncharacterized YccA/Bax inhibitor family protein